MFPYVSFTSCLEHDMLSAGIMTADTCIKCQEFPGSLESAQNDLLRWGSKPSSVSPRQLELLIHFQVQL